MYLYMEYKNSLVAMLIIQQGIDLAEGIIELRAVITIDYHGEHSSLDLHTLFFLPLLIYTKLLYSKVSISSFGLVMQIA